MVTMSITSPFLQGATLQTTDGWVAARKLCTAPTQAIATEIETKGLAAWIDSQLYPDKIQENPRYELERQALFPSMFAPRQASKTRDKIFWDNYQKVSVRPYNVATYVIEAAMHRMWASRKQLQNTMALFWSDVAASSLSKAPDGYHDYIGTLYDGALGKYKDLLWNLINTRTISMFLDNHTNTRYALNENMGREIMELYSFGAEKGYTQKDVVAVATLMTGFRGDISSYGSGADPAYHHFGAITVLGKTFANKGSTAQDMYATLRELINFLAVDRLTGLRIARRLIKHFIGDQLNTEALAQQLADLYMANDTDVRPMIRALVLSPLFLQSAGHTARRPWSVLCGLMASANLSLKGTVSFATSTSLYAPLYRMWWMLYEYAGGVPFNAPQTDGYPLEAHAWMSSAHYVGITKLTRFTNYIDTWDGSDPSKFTLWSNPISWAGALGITLGRTTLKDSAKIIFRSLTGYEADDHLIGSLMAYAVTRTPTAVSGFNPATVASQTVTDEHIKRMIEAALTAPHFMLA